MTRLPTAIRRPLAWAWRVTRASPLKHPLIDLFIRLHTLAYAVLTVLVVEQGRHPKHRIQNYHQFFVDNLASTDRVLDVGCGDGDVAYDMAKRAGMVVGIDRDPKHIATARQRYQHPHLTFLVADALSFTSPDGFDVITLSNVLEHLRDRVALLKHWQTLAPRFLIRVPLLTRDWLTVYKRERGYEYRLDHTHQIEYTEASFAAEMTAAGLLVERAHVAFGELYAVVRRPDTARATSAGQSLVSATSSAVGQWPM